MLSDDVFRSRLLATIESLRYFVPSVADVARSEENSSSGFWKVSMTPLTHGACPVELILHGTQRYDVMIGSETYEDREITSLELFVPLMEAISAGLVLERTWFSLSTGAKIGRETIVTLPKGSIWQDGSGMKGVCGQEDKLRREDRHFLPYRR
ncbi:MAG: hypothetical protein ABL894_03925 [Hyphomicrobium sp.]